MELISFNGNLTWDNEDIPVVHAHVILCDKDLLTYGAIVFRLQLVLQESLWFNRLTGQRIIRSLDPDMGLKLIQDW